MEKQDREKDLVLQVKDLKINIKTDDGILTPVRGVNFEIGKGETLGLVGESGCGKSLTSKAILGINAKNCKAEGEILFDAENLGMTDLLKLKPRGEEIRSIRGKQISMIFQEPMVAFSPMYTIGNQINEATLLHITKDKKKAKEISLGVMKKVGIANAEKRYDQYPHEFSGGMLQRALIAMALVCNPKLLIADEPTTALDVTIQAQILDLLENLKKKIGSSIMLITHDLGVVAGMADYVVVMYAGRVIEKGTADDIFHHPAHPYTIGLMKSKPVVGKKVEELYNIPGSVPNPVNMPNYCYFRDRCEMQCDMCAGKYPPSIRISDTHVVSCYRFYDEKNVIEYPKTVNPEEL